jgi:hypothetical protein
MSKHTGVFTRMLLAAALLLGAALSGRAQSMEGYSDIWYDETTDNVVFYALTWPDYATGYYYETNNYMHIYADSVWVTNWATPSSPEIGPWTEGYMEMPAQPGVSYSVVAEHWLGAHFCWWEIDPYFCSNGCYDWYDAYGYSFLSANQSPYYSYIMRIPPMVCAAVMSIALTAVTQTVRDAFVPELNCDPNPATRGVNVTCTVSGAGFLQVSGWRFEGGGATVTGPFGGHSWSGIMVQEGTVTATILGYVVEPKFITVNNRSWWHTQPAEAEPADNGTIVVKGVTLTLPVPPQPSGDDSGLGVFGWDAAWSGQGTTIIGSGPNKDFAYFASPISFTTFFAKYTINPDLVNSGSTFSQKQWGACGFISHGNLLTQTRRHEYNHTTQSHYGKYVSAMNDQSKNLGDYWESRVAPPNTNLEQFVQATTSGLQSRVNGIDTMTKAQPYPVNYSETDEPLGNINYDAPYVECP